MQTLTIETEELNQLAHDFSLKEFNKIRTQRVTLAKVKQIIESPYLDNQLKRSQLEKLWRDVFKKPYNAQPTISLKRATNKGLGINTKEPLVTFEPIKSIELTQPTISTDEIVKNSNQQLMTEKCLSEREMLVDEVETSGQKVPTCPNSVCLLSEYSLDVLDEKLLRALNKYGFNAEFVQNNSKRRLRVFLSQHPASEIIVRGTEDSIEHLKNAWALFTFSKKYEDIKPPPQLKKLLRFFWNGQVKQYKNSVKLLKKQVETYTLFFERLSLNDLLFLQTVWSDLSAVNKANILIELKFRLGFVSKRNLLTAALVQPEIRKQFLLENPHHRLSINENEVSNLLKSNNPIFSKLTIFKWPSTIASEADGSLPEVEWPKIGVLKAVGYTVGAQGLLQADRRTILTNVYMQSLPYVDSRSYMNEWGEPLSSDRLKKMAETLASLTKGAKRKTQANMKQAIRDWESDLAWLKEQYYLEHKYLWVWPRAGNKDESDLELTIKEKHYQSSREFLIEQYTNKANELCCQICQSALPFKLESGEYFWEEIPVTKSINSSPYSDLILCPNHRAMYLHTNSKPNQLLENLGDSFSKKLSIELASEQVSIFVTELHQKKLRLAKELMPRTKASSCLFDFSNIPQGLQGVKKLYLYENQSSWIVSSRAMVIATLTSKSEAKQWLAGFDEHRGVISTITEKVPTPKSKKTKQPKLKARSSLSVAAVRFGTVKKAEPQSSYKSGYSLCTTCNGDGGINGGCWKCGGSGWM
ncbi:hypothetical protein [Vibrio crassostreae]|uniref:hypothetical protein n=1 Tax=Vibrio crassostreae TaxID=246167 RepID=UPI000638BDE8|nr:hypothetical protein [Vibrio crassostreae]TCO03159.1 hypothetical protein EDB30_105139 [Vibrio crassostreae]CAK1735148.1 conserved hypothetical protein [Vibrio crassostreae]CAK1736044.1 conserved hypothetical protein [Vibrio crassostreae]CAK1736088.1 conserved hypothetical protein [Vibrio crassostreae]CAK2136862.1 conserved hypothetical protein [Vibrio crassostreae]